MTDQIRVLHVDDDPDLADLAASFLEREDDRIAVETATDATAGLSALDDREIDCVVSDHDMPGRNGIEFLRLVRERNPDLPFILYTGKGSEAVASDAISAGVTDYLQKGGGTEQYEILANRIADAVEKRRFEREAERTRAHLQAITAHSMDGIVTIDASGTIRFANPAVERLFGYDPNDLVGKPLGRLMPERKRDAYGRGLERFLETDNRSLDWSNVEFSGRHHDGHEIPLSISFGEFEEDGEKRFVGMLRDVTERDRHRAFVEHSGDIVTMLDGDGGFQYLSPSTEQIVGYEPDELLGDIVFEYIHPEDRETVEAVLYGSFGDSERDEDSERGGDSGRGGDHAVEYRFRCADGEYRWLESVWSDRHTEDAIRGYVINTRDVSERKRREVKLAQLREWTQQLNYTRTIEETTRLAVNAVDEIVGAQLSGIHLLNEAGDRLEPAALADSVSALFDGPPSYDRDSPEGSRAELAWEAYGSEEPIAIDELSSSDRLAEETPAESLVLHPIGEHGIFVISASTPHTFTDTDVLIAEIIANHLETALDRVARESSLERLHDATRDLIRAESREAIAERIVDAAEDVLGFSVATVRLYDEEAAGLVPVAASDAVAEILPDRTVFTADGGSLNWAAFEAGEVQVHADVEVDDGFDAGTGLRSLMILPIGDDGTLAVGVTEPNVFDGTDEFLARILATAAETAFRSEERTRRLHERSAELERQNDRLEEFASVVSHDLRNPLNVAQGRVELARDEFDSDHLAAAAGAHERMETLIEDLLALAREGNRVDETATVSLAAVTESCWQNVDTAAATLTVERDVALAADESRLRQLIENLIRNAVEHAGPDVTVTIGALDDGSGFYVADDGPGISESMREDIFDAGVSTTRTGTGFGLRIVEQVANAHGWAVSVGDGGKGGAGDEPTSGACFEVSGVEIVDAAG
ncbi:PAS domain S-box protein [Halorubrum sp. DTA46]|uniref:hybrid sensor histidine kinase/response regulator n=1 Tax=Halorubrum sp. DTA46 TaxID=3402162 RepID=UPI003AAEB42C